jgi:hypothetical protein
MAFCGIGNHILKIVFVTDSIAIVDIFFSYSAL